MSLDDGEEFSGDEPAPEIEQKPKTNTAEYQRQRRARLKAQSEGGETPSPSGKVHNLFADSVPRAPRPRAKRNLDAAKMSLQMAHIAIAARLNEPSFMLSDDEAHMLADAGANLLEYYNIKISGKNGAILMMAQAVGIVYGPRLFNMFFGAKFGTVGTQNNAA